MAAPTVAEIERAFTVAQGTGPVVRINAAEFRALLLQLYAMPVGSISPELAFSVAPGTGVVTLIDDSWVRRVLLSMQPGIGVTVGQIEDCFAAAAGTGDVVGIINYRLRLLFLAISFPPVFPAAIFDLPLTDSGNGVVSLVPVIAGSPGAIFARATTGYTEKADGTLVQTGIDTPRSIYRGGAYHGYLNEAAGTNSFLQSVAIADAAWAKYKATVTSTTEAAPDGTLTATKLLATEFFLPDDYGINPAAGIPAGNYGTLSCFMLAGSSNYGCLTFAGDAGVNGAVFDLLAGTVFSVAPGLTAGIYKYGNSGWFRCFVINPNVAAAAYYPTIRIGSLIGEYWFAAVGTESITVWGPQIEQSTPDRPSSYIPTTVAAVSRAADALNYPAAGNILTAVGSAAAEVWNVSYTSGGLPRIIADSTVNNGAILGFLSSATQIQTQIYDGAVQLSSPGIGNSVGVNKMATNWTGVVMKAVLNAGAIGSGAFDGTMAVNGIRIGYDNLGGSNLQGAIKNVKIWNIALTDAQLQQATA